MKKYFYIIPFLFAGTSVNAITIVNNTGQEVTITIYSSIGGIFYRFPYSIPPKGKAKGKMASEFGTIQYYVKNPQEAEVYISAFIANDPNNQNPLTSCNDIIRITEDTNVENLDNLTVYMYPGVNKCTSIG